MIVKLDESHHELTQPLFQSSAIHQYYCDTYLSGLRNFHAYGNIVDGVITDFISYYAHSDDPSYYITRYRSTNQDSALLNTVVTHNENDGRLKFYIRTDVVSLATPDRYEYHDEYLVPAKTRCYYSVPWEILFNRTLANTDAVVRCYYLKQQYRTNLPTGGYI
jgi:hypothetical protein